MKLSFTGFFFILLTLANGTAQSQLQKSIDDFVADPRFSHASISISVLDKKTGAALAAFHPQTTLIPASTLKVLTTAIALEVLGEDFQFKTYLQYDGLLTADGILKGNLYIRGEGDPTLGSHHFDLAETMDVVVEKWVQAVKTLGIKKVEGKIIGDASYFSDAPCVASWPWEDLGNYYGSGAWGLNLQENLYFLHLRQKNRLGAAPDLIKTEPEIPNLLLLNELKSAEKGSGDQAYIFGGPYAYTRFVRGTIPVGTGIFKVKGSVPDPPFFAAHQLMLALRQQGIDCSEGATSLLEWNRTSPFRDQNKRPGATAERKSFYTYSSPPLKEIVKEANLKSVNIYCEAMLKAMGSKATGEGTTAAGLKVVREKLAAMGIEADGLFLEDGSGLSPRNAISSGQLANFLFQASQKNQTFTTFYRSLAVGGQSGTLQYLFKKTLADGRIIGKSGGMERVRSYAGYATQVNGREVVFAMIINNYSGEAAVIRRKMESLMIDFCK